MRRQREGESAHVSGGPEPFRLEKRAMKNVEKRGSRYRAHVRHGRRGDAVRCRGPWRASAQEAQGDAAELKRAPVRRCRAVAAALRAKVAPRRALPRGVHRSSFPRGFLALHVVKDAIGMILEFLVLAESP